MSWFSIHLRPILPKESKYQWFLSLRMRLLSKSFYPLSIQFLAFISLSILQTFFRWCFCLANALFRSFKYRSILFLPGFASLRLSSNVFSAKIARELIWFLSLSEDERQKIRIFLFFFDLHALRPNLFWFWLFRFHFELNLWYQVQEQNDFWSNQMHSCIPL